MALCAVALSVGFTLLTPSAAPARRLVENAQSSPTRGQGRCTIQLSIASPTLTAGESATLSGALACPTSVSAAEQTVTLYQRDAGTPGFSIVGTATTEASGAYRFTTEALETNVVLYARSPGARSQRVSVEVMPLVTFVGPPEDSLLSLVAGRSEAGLGAANSVTFTGTVDPDAAGALVILQRESDTVSENWRPIAITEVGADGEYSITHRFSSTGTTNVRVLVRDRGRLASVSEPLSYQIAQRQNPRLTIHASPTALSHGESVTLSGTASAAAHDKLSLLARTRQSSFVTVATVTTDDGGNYTFPAQSPLQNTVYEVSAGALSSVALSESVKPLLTAQVSSASIQAGEPLTFTGTVAPARAGQDVYLERQNLDGVGFHVVATATLGADGAYSIEHTVSGGGVQVFRVKVPGDVESQAVASEPFEVDVAPAADELLQAPALGSASTPSGES